MDEDEIPELGDSFSAGDAPGYEDGDWPDFLAQSMLDWMPTQIQKTYGKLGDTTLNGFTLDLPPENLGPIIATLEADGYRCEEDQELLDAADGYSVE